jgi:hypothetical protein
VSELVEADSEGTLVEADKMFRLVGDTRVEVLPYNTVPIWSILVIEEVLYLFGYL